jgi:DNA mismatch repair protein MutL
LDKKTINQIAAGEVVERPASVVKELLENAIDAKSKRIIIELESAGRKSIRVMDDGDGMAPEDLKLAFEKHSTSKISNINDVYKISTLGFRGEALASIGAVGRVECISCDGKHMPGRKLVLEGGAVRSFSEVGCPKGTTVKVKDIFYNLPARHKYLKSDQTELAHIIDVVTQMAIYHNRIGFKLVHNSNELLNFPGTKNHINNLVNIYGKELARNLIPISFQHSHIKFDNSGAKKDQDGKDEIDEQQATKISITGHIGKPSVTRNDRSYQSIFVNGRYVENKTISNAIKESYRTLVMKNRYPIVILFIQIDPEVVDVNISPTKLQIRFESEKDIYDSVYRNIRETLRTHDLIPEVPIPQGPKHVTLKAITTLGIGKPGYYSILPEPLEKPHSQPSLPLHPKTQEKEEEYSKGLFPGLRVKQSVLLPDRQEKLVTVKPKLEILDAEAKLNKIQSTLPFMHPIGQIMDTYIIAQAGENLLIIDQHAAHERIMYEKIKIRYSDMTMATQELLEPVELELSPNELGLLKTNLDTLSELNFIIDELGDNKFYVKAIPIIIGRLQEPEFIHDMINDLITVTYDRKSERIQDKMIQVMACKAAIKAGKPMNIPEIQQLLNELYSIDNPYTCAHGRPTIISMTEMQLKKLFKRIV